MRHYIAALLFMLVLPWLAIAQVVPNFCSATNSAANAYACNMSPAIASYTLGAQYIFRANGANTNPATLSLNGLPPVAIVKTLGNQLSVNDIRNNQLVVVIFDGSNFQLQSPVGNEPVPSGLRLISTVSAGCPTGWSEDTAARGRYLVGTPSGATVGNTLGTAMTQTGGTVDDSSYTPAGTNGTVSYTPAGTNGTSATTGNCAATNIAAGTGAADACKGVAPNLTVSAQVFTGTAATISAQAFTGTAAATMRSTVAPVLQIIICSKN